MAISVHCTNFLSGPLQKVTNSHECLSRYTLTRKELTVCKFTPKNCKQNRAVN